MRKNKKTYTEEVTVEDQAESLGLLIWKAKVMEDKETTLADIEELKDIKTFEQAEQFKQNRNNK